MAVFTNIGEAHLAGLKTLGGVFREKFHLVKNMYPKGRVIFNHDDRYLKSIENKEMTQGKISYSFKDKAHFMAHDIHLKNNSLQFKVNKKTAIERRLNYVDLS